MLVVMQEGATEAQIEHVIGRLVELGFDVHRSTGVIHTVLGGVGGNYYDTALFEVLPGVKEAHPIVSPYKLASRSARPHNTIIELTGGVQIGGPEVIVMAGPCSVETQSRNCLKIECGAGMFPVCERSPTVWVVKSGDEPYLDHIPCSEGTNTVN